MFNLNTNMDMERKIIVEMNTAQTKHRLTHTGTTHKYTQQNSILKCHIDTTQRMN